MRPRRPWQLTATAALLALALGLGGCGGREDRRSSTDSADDGKQRLADLRERLGATAKTATAAGCTISAPKEGPPDHVDSVEDVDYSSDPPSSGPHLADWAAWGFYDEPVPDGNLVHNLEHGGVALWYGEDALDGERRGVVRDEVLDDGEKWIVSPRDSLEGIVSSAWGMQLHCPPAALDKLDDSALRTLLDDWYEATHSRGTEQEKNVGPYAGALTQPQPERDISEDPPESFGA